MAKILVVEDEKNMRDGLRDNLEFEGYEVDTAENGEVAIHKAQSTTFDLILLDVMLPKVSGFDVCKTLRKAGVTSSIIILTAKGEEIDKVLGLELGADDYVTKPFSLRELLARIKAVLRRTEDTNQQRPSNASPFVTIGRLSINFDSYTAFEGSEEIPLTHKEFEIIHFLWKNRNSTVSRDRLLTEIWGYDENPTTRTVDNFILKIRQKLEKDPNKPQIIITVYGVGYKFIEV